MFPNFGRAPVSKCLCFLSAVGSLAAAFANRLDLFTLDLNNTFGKAQLWRLVSSNLVFSSPSGIFFGISLLYMFREFEKRFKSSKFAVCIVVISVLSSILQIVLLATQLTKKLAPGPYGIVFGLFTFFFSEIPPSVKGGIAFVPMTDKTFTYLFGLQLMFAEFPSSCWPSVCGLIAGVLYRSRMLPFRKISVPEGLKNFCSRNCTCFNASARRRRRRGAYHQVPENDPTMPQQLFGPPPAIPTAAPDPACVETLVSMGFDEERARSALARTHNNIEAAVGLLGSAW